MWDISLTKGVSISLSSSGWYIARMSWDNDARQILKVEVVRRGLTYERLAKLMQVSGVEETSRSIANKMSRGTFTFVFFLQVMKAMGAKTVTIEVPTGSSPTGEIQSQDPAQSRGST